MTEAEYTDFHNKLCNLYNYVASARCRAWMRPDVRLEILNRVKEMRVEFYRIKKAAPAPLPSNPSNDLPADLRYHAKHVTQGAHTMERAADEIERLTRGMNVVEKI